MAKRGEILPPCALDFSPLLLRRPLRADMLFFIRVSGVYCQNIFWQIFNKHHKNARKRRRLLLAKALELIDNDCKQGGAVCRQCRENPCSCLKIGNKSSLRREFVSAADYSILHMRKADILDGGFVCLMRALGENKEIRTVFSAALKQRHGLQWDFGEFIDAVQILREQRGFLEHYQERVDKCRSGKKAQIPSNADNTKLFMALGRLLLPDLSNELLHSAQRAKKAESYSAAAEAEQILNCAKQWRKQSIRKMFAEERPGRAEGAGKALGASAPPRAVPKAQRKSFLTEEWFKYYQALGFAKTNFRAYTFKFHYDFIGKKHFAEIFKILGVPLKNGSFPDRERVKRLNFTHDIIPFYVLILRLTKILHYYCEELKNKKENMPSPQLKEIRNAIAHNGLFWQIPDKIDKREHGKMLSVNAVFLEIINALPKVQASAFCDKIESLLRQGNYPIWHGESGGVPKTEKLRHFHKRKRAELTKNAGNLDKRQKVRRVLARWLRDLRKAGKNSKYNLQKAGRNAL